ncbi:MAG: hypothetical protein ACOCXZ_02595 [Chloroflexota bacterium]
MSSTTAPPRRTQKPVRFSRVVLPLVLIAAGLLALLLLLVLSFSPTGLQEPGQVSIISNLFLICLALCPVMLCLFPLYVILMVGVYGINRAERGGRHSLRRARRVSRRAADATASVSDRLSQRSIDIGTRLAYLDRAFDQDKRDQSPENDTTHE